MRIDIIKRDASGSVQAALYGRVFEANVHEDGRPWWPSATLLCPADVGAGCARCSLGMPRVPVSLCLCKSGKKWAVVMLDRGEMRRIMAACSRMGYSEREMREGNGPELILQDGTEPMLIPPTRPRSLGAPSLEDHLASLYGRSSWKTS